MFSSETVHRPPSGFIVREATPSDVEDLTRLWYSSFNPSFNPSHKFWDEITAEDQETRQWFNDAWMMGIEAGSKVLRTHVVEDLCQERRIVAVARWNVPQQDGEQNIPLPSYPPEWDAELTSALWDGMPRNRAIVMGKRSHWCELSLSSEDFCDTTQYRIAHAFGSTGFGS
jgi:hypothetical protein